jgi:D-sedoheptulose 7-phosphate isomerase
VPHRTGPHAGARSPVLRAPTRPGSGRPGDVLPAFSTSGRSPNVPAAVEAAHEVGMVSWAATGAAPNPLVGAAHDGIAVPATSTATVQEVHQVAIHLLCESIDARVREVSR